MPNKLIQNYLQYRFTSDAQRQSMPLWFVPDVMFILNISPATFYLRTGSLRIPTADNADIVIPPNTYYSFTPYKNVQEYAGFLDNPTAWDCWIWFRKGDAALPLAEINFPFPDLNIQIELSPMPDPTVIADFTYTVLP